MSFKTNIGITEAFAHYGAELKNNRWAVSSKASNGDIVISCWDDFLKGRDGKLIYDDTLSRWSDANPGGKSLLLEHLTEAHRDQLTVRLVIARRAKADSNRIAESFGIRPDLRGKVTEFDGDRFVLTFTR